MPLTDAARHLCHRPLLLLAPVVGLSSAIGLESAHSVRYNLPIVGFSLTVLAALLLLGTALGLTSQSEVTHQRDLTRQREKLPWLPLLIALLAMAGCIIVPAVMRKAPPAGDISGFVRGIMVPQGPQQPVTGTLRGWVAASPRNGEFGAEFPLQVAAFESEGHHYAPSGMAWCRVPLGTGVQVGDLVRLKVTLTDLPRIGNRGERDSANQYISAGCWCLAKVHEAGDIQIESRAQRYPVARGIAALGALLPRRYEQSFRDAGRPYPQATAQLLAAMVFGEGGLQEALPQTLSQAFRAAGLSHLTVVSGSQIVMTVALLLGLAKILGIRNSWLPLVFLPALVCYALLAGNDASIWRAVISGLCLTWALVQGRDVDGLSLWSLAFIVLLLIDPLQLHDIGFQLSFAATWGLIVLAPRLKGLVSRLAKPNAIIDAAVLSLAAQIATTPLLLYHFGSISFSGLTANLLAVPLTGVLLGTGFLGLIVPPINGFNYLLTTSIQNTAFSAAQVPGSSALLLPVSFQTAALIYLVIFLMLPSRQFYQDAKTMLTADFSRWLRRLRAGGQDRPKRLGWMLSLAVVTFAVLALALSSRRDGTLRVTVLDVGQGESIVIRGPGGNTVLVDGGTSSTERRGDVGRSVIVPYLQSIGARGLNAMILTHADSDHCNGLRTVVREVPVAKAIDGAAAVPGQSYASAPEYTELRDAWRRHGVPVEALKAFSYDLGGGAKLTVLPPPAPAFAGDNNNSAVLKIEYGETSFLLTGDIEREAEDRLLSLNLDLKSTVLKVGHHGSNTSTTSAFLQKVKPRLAVISCGRYNDFGHPAPEILERLAQNNVATFRTDRDGSVEFISYGRESWVQTMR